MKHIMDLVGILEHGDPVYVIVMNIKIYRYFEKSK